MDVCVVTGATRGIGRTTAEAVAAMGATVLLHGRDAAAVDAACREISESTGNRKVTGIVADLSSMDEVRRLAQEIRARTDRLDLLINNAGTATLRRKSTIDGFELLFAVNHLAPFLLTNLLLDEIKASAPARIVTVASGAHRRATLDLDDLNWEHRKYRGLEAYGASKLANILFTRELARRLGGTGVTANCLHPGVVATNIFNNLGWIGWLFSVLARSRMLSPSEGAATSIYVATSPEVAGVSGKYFDKSKEAEPAAAARDAVAARQLWEISARLTGLPR